ncbi:DUF1846 domain-containing protein [Alkalibacter rhizosphaerae]|uniref:UPF0371 protein J0B03_08565 n=1 Tax=Alkalibacter rhizosphaerae TaxID=2815577 RepID=A0A974XDI9_9FIRM|nr:DUF1846 domain-containing protein [Alkalibacter rhizosphaerae]QSX07862.1 DUF1846 domain-containing protein [Alkalibacter rhizosphaerae]
MRIGFDNEQYKKTQSEHIKERIGLFGNKLYLEFGGKLFDDYHSSRVLPGFEPDSKLKMLDQLKDQLEIVIVISADDIENNKIRGDHGITYDNDVLRLIDAFQGRGFMVGSVVITQYTGENAATRFRQKLESLHIKTYLHYTIDGYPHNVSHIVSDEGYGKNEYVETTRPLVVVTAPGPGSGKMSTCLSQLYHDHQRGIEAGYAKFETFPIWNLPLRHPVNIAYEAATADLDDVNMIDPFHLEAYGKPTVNYNRDIEIFPVLNAIFELIVGKNPYKSPTDMGVNMAGNCIIDDAVCQEAARQEIIRRYYTALLDFKRGRGTKEIVYKLELLMKQAGVTVEHRKVIKPALDRELETGHPAAAIELHDGRIITGKTSDLLGCSAAVILNAIKELGGIDHDMHLVSPEAIEPIQTLKTKYLKGKNPRLHSDEILIALSVSAAHNEHAKCALEQLSKLRHCQLHSSVILSSVDEKIFKKLGIHVTCEPKYETDRMYQSH